MYYMTNRLLQINILCMLSDYAWLDHDHDHGHGVGLHHYHGFEVCIHGHNINVTYHESGIMT